MPVKASKAKAAPAAEPAAGAQVDRNQALATFDGGQVTVGDLLDAIAARAPAQRASFARPEARPQLLRDLEQYALLVQEAKRRGFENHTAVGYATRKASIDALKQNQLSVDPASIPSADVDKEYEAQRAKYERPAVRRASLIVVATEAEAKALTRELAKATRETFGEAARSRSLDEATRKQSGELGWFSSKGLSADGRPTKVDPDMVAATWRLAKVGAITPKPLKLANGFGVLMYTGEMPGVKTSRAEADGEIREHIASRQATSRVAKLATNLRDQIKVELHPELTEAVKLDKPKVLDIPQGFPAHPPDPRVGPKQVVPDKY